MKEKRYIFPLLMGCTMSCIMSQLNTGKIVFPAIVAMMVLQSMVASIASFVFPAGLVGAKLTHRLYKGKSYVVFLLISSILPAIYFTAIMSISGLLRMMGYHENFWKIYLTETGKLKYEPFANALRQFNQELTSEWTEEQYEFVYQSLEMLKKKFEEEI